MKDLEDQAFNLRDGDRIYLDHNATTPLATELVPLINEWIKAWGNPSSIHCSGRGPKALLRDARKNIADMIGASPQEIVFTAGGSEGNNFLLKGAFEEISKSTGRKTILVSSVEHPSVRDTAKYLETKGAILKWIPVLRDGTLDLDFLQKNLDETVAIVSVMAANNETGVIFPIKKMAPMVRAVGALFHSDFVQALGKFPVDMKKMDVDLASFAGHKFYALKGSGFVFIKRGTQIQPLIHGGGQERHRRAGTENSLAIASLGHMSKRKDEVSAAYVRIAELRNKMEAEIQSRISGVEITAHQALRLPNTSSLLISGIDGESLLINLDVAGISVSTGAACSSGTPEPSPVLLAMGLTRKEAQSSLRLSLGWGTTESEISRFIDVLVEVVARLREAHIVRPLEASL
jgi:cysteine desulfurase